MCDPTFVESEEAGLRRIVIRGKGSTNILEAYYDDHLISTSLSSSAGDQCMYIYIYDFKKKTVGNLQQLLKALPLHIGAAKACYTRLKSRWERWPGKLCKLDPPVETPASVENMGTKYLLLQSLDTNRQFTYNIDNNANGDISRKKSSICPSWAKIFSRE